MIGAHKTIMQAPRKPDAEPRGAETDARAYSRSESYLAGAEGKARARAAPADVKRAPATPLRSSDGAKEAAAADSLSSRDRAQRVERAKCVSGGR